MRRLIDVSNPLGASAVHANGAEGGSNTWRDVTIWNDASALIGPREAQRSAGQRDDTIIKIRWRVVATGIADDGQSVDAAQIILPLIPPGKAPEECEMNQNWAYQSE